MGIVFKNNAKTTLASNLTSSATSASVTDGSVFPSLSAGEFFLITFDDGTNNEICKCTARSGNTLTIVRAQESTTARAFSSGDAAEGRVTAGVLETIQENIAAKSANQTVYNTTTASSATDYDIGIDPSVEANAMVFLNGVMQHHNTFSFSGSTLTFDTAPPDGMALEVIVDNLINLQSSNLTVDTFTAADVGGNPQTDFVLSDTPAAEDNLLVFIDGVFQDQDAYTISNQTLTITDGVTADFGVTVYVINPVNIGTPSDGTVTSSKLSGNITMPADLTVTGDVTFDSPTFVVDNANSRVGIGTASPSTLLDIVGDVKMSANLTVDTSTLVVDATNNRVGIGTTSPTRKLSILGTGSEYINIVGGTTSGVGLLLGDSNAEINAAIICDNSTDSLNFRTGGNNTRMTIDSSGNLLVSHTGNVYNNINTTSTIGSSYTVNGEIFACSDQSSGVMILNRKSSDGVIATFKKDGSTVGSIATQGGEICLMADSGGGIRVRSGASSVIPVNAARTNLDATTDLGSSSARFKDLYLSGGTTSDGVSTSNTHTIKNLNITNAGGSTGGTTPRLYSPASATLAISTGSTERMRIDSSGKVLVGGTSSGGTGKVQADVGFDAMDGSFTTSIAIRNYSSAANSGSIIVDPDNLGASSVMYFGIDGITPAKMKLDSAGRLNIDQVDTRFGTGALNIVGEVGTSYRAIEFRHNASTIVGTVVTTASSTAYNTSSDYRLKENVDYTWDATTRLKQLKPARFNFIDDDTNTLVDGFLAHEVQDIVPEAITGEKDAVKEEEYEVTPAVLDDDGNVVTKAVMGTREVPEYQGIDQSKLVPLLTKAIQEQQTQIETLKQEIREIREGG